MRLPFYWIDAFASAPFRGNPAGVVPLDSWLDAGLMQKIAFEHGLSETAFFVRTGPGQFDLRWFTPGTEVDLCGHATLASAYVVFHELGEPAEVITFRTRSGSLLVKKAGNKLLEMDFPSQPPVECKDPALWNAVVAALSAKPRWLGKTPFDVFAVFTSQAIIENLKPDFPKIAALGGRGVIVTAAGEGNHIDFVSRFFAPQCGILEDPVTGSAHCALVPYWAHHTGKKSLQARQISARTGELQCTLEADRVKMAGSAVLYLRGEINV